MSIANVSYGEAGDYEAITVSNTAIGFTAAKIAVDSPVGLEKAGKAVVSVETGQIRVTTDGTTPTSTVGILRSPGQSFTVKGPEGVAAFRAIRVSADASMKCQYYRQEEKT